ncbi:hypothetical protein GCM10010172_05050 [Paractinoplanes ferrugineus]|uniref:Uncharacterized protein n=1 Tax=Paractinoplanes ferrugineus TaxID=113564 RepID=A0A919J286_9ACTN|nr:hypothetical protein [Actinoplanes ferrugineus]GIE12578.1 hypothetical protein Afe05nite_44180 [Actinoplanes ferrugineus]
MTEDLRAWFEAELNAERPPPLGDVVGTAIRDGRRLRRKRRLTLLGSIAALIAVLGSGAVMLGDPLVTQREALSPQSVPPGTAAPIPALEARTLTIHSGTAGAVGSRTKATSAAMLHLLTQLLPPGRTSHLGIAPDDDLRVQLYVDDGRGSAMVRVAVAKNSPFGDESSRGGMATVLITHDPDNCLTALTVDAEWPDGTLVEVDVPTCLAGAEPSRAALTADQAVMLATDPRWGVTMDRQLVAEAAERFDRVPVAAE